MGLLISQVTFPNKEKKDLLIEGNRIKEISANIGKGKHRVISGENKALLPGLVNGHTHSAMTLLRGYGDDMELFPWLQEKIWPAEAHYIEEDYYWGYRLAFLEMIKTGTVFFNDMYFQQDIALQALKDSGLRGAINFVFLNPGTPEKEKEQIDQCLSWFDKIQENELAHFSGLAPHSIYTVTKETLQWIADFSKDRELKVQIHLSETEQENLNCQKQWGMSPTAYLESLNLLSPRLSIAHGLWLDQEDQKRLKDYSVSVVHNPASNMKLASGPAMDYSSLKSQDINILLGSDGCSSSNNLDMIEHMKLAAFLQKQHYNDATRMSAHEVFHMATLAGADFWQTGGGKLKEGAIADLMLVRLDIPEMTPCHDIISNLVYSANGSAVDSLIVQGELVMEERKVKDEADIISKAQQVASDLIKRTETN